MFILFSVAVLLAAVALAGGRLSRLGALRVREPWLLPAALGLQILVTEVMRSRGDGWLDSSLHIVSYVLAAVFLVRNRRVPGLLVIGAGATMNGVTIALNGGELPASARALRAAHIEQVPGQFANSGTVAHPVLGFLGDIAATPSWLPFQNVISIGDVTILVGVAWLCWATCGTRWSRRPGPTAAAGPAPIDTPFGATEHVAA